MTNSMNVLNNQQTPSITRPWGVPPAAVHLVTNSWGTSDLWVFRSNNKIHVQYGFQSVYETSNGGGGDKNVSEPVYKKLSQLMAKDGYRFVLDMPGEFERADIDVARATFKKAIETTMIIDDTERSPIHDVYLWLCEYVKEHIKEDIITVTTDKDGCQFASIETQTFDELVISEGWGWKPLEVKKRFKQLQLLRVNAGRAYDCAMTNKNEQTYRTISFKLEVAHNA